MINFGIQIQVIVKPQNIKNLEKSLINFDQILQSKFDKNSTQKSDCSYFFKDYTIQVDNFLDYGLQIRTIPLSYNRENIFKIYRLLQNMKNYVYTNDSCGIHVHFSKENLNTKDYFYILYNYLNDKQDKKLLNFKGLNLFNQNYANYKNCRKKYLYDINSCLRNNKYYIIDTDAYYKKYLYEVRPDFDTIEYRGLRYHFKELDNIDIIYLIEFFIKNISYYASIDNKNSKITKIMKYKF